MDEAIKNVVIHYFTVDYLCDIVSDDGIFVKDENLLNLILKYAAIVNKITMTLMDAGEQEYAEYADDSKDDNTIEDNTTDDSKDADSDFDDETYSETETDFPFYDEFESVEELAFSDMLSILETISYVVQQLIEFSYGDIENINISQCFTDIDQDLHNEAAGNIKNLIEKEDFSISDVSISNVIFNDVFDIESGKDIVQDFYLVISRSVAKQSFNPNLSSSDKRKLDILLSYTQDWSHQTIKCIDKFVNKLNSMQCALSSTWLN